MSSNLEHVDWPQWVKRSAQEALSEPAKTNVLEWTRPESLVRSIESANLLQQETAEALELISRPDDRGSVWGGLLGLQDLAPDLDRLKRGAVLEIDALARTLSWLKVVDAWVSIPAHAWGTLQIPLWRASQKLLMQPGPCMRKLQQVLGPLEGRDGQLSERASPRLWEIIQSIRSLRVDIERQMEGLVRHWDAQGVLQEAFYDQHDGRLVLPVRVSDQSKIPGNVYGASVSKQTVFVEPEAIRAPNNRLKQLENDRAQEVYRILQEISAELYKDESKIRTSFEQVLRWDAIRARARMAQLTSGKAIQVTEAKSGAKWLLFDTVHPLLFSACGSGLEDRTLTRNSLVLEHKGLLLSGPNTGGKTVFLKTIAVASLCSRSGFFLPGSEKHTVPLMHHLCIDAGDPQSIETHRSSFSGRILQLKDIFTALDERSAAAPAALVLLDELGSATDPEEGSALARAIVEDLLDRPNTTVIITSHDPAVKAFALDHKAILAGGLEFDDATGQPTFRIRWNIMGRSRALETAARLGLAPSLVDRARRYMSAGHRKLEEGLARLEHDAKEAESARKEAQRLKAEAEAAQSEWLERRREGVQAILNQVRTKMKRASELFQDELKALAQTFVTVRSANDARVLREKFDAVVSRAAQQLDEVLQDQGMQSDDHTHTDRADAEHQALWSVGQTVGVRKWNVQGVIESIDVQKGRAKVRAGNRSVDVSMSDLRQAFEPSQKSKPKRTFTSFAAAFERPSDVPGKLDLRGKRLDVAMVELESYLDQAFRSGRLEVEIIHGLGTGALREGSIDRIKNLPYVESFEDGGAGRGGAGCTVVRFSRHVG